MLQDLYRLPSFQESGLPRLIEWARGNGLSFGVERSVRLRNRTLETHRCLLSFVLSPVFAAPGDSAADMNRQAWLLTLSTVTEICQSLGCPEDVVAGIRRFFPAAGFVHFGFEESAGRAILKCYLELPSDAENSHGEPDRPAESRIQFLGYKWRATDPLQSVVTLYRTWNSSGDGSTVQKFVEETPNIFRPFAGELQNLLECTARSFGHDQMHGGDCYPLLEVRDEGGVRCSWDLNIYDAQLQIGQLPESLLATLPEIAVSDVMAQWLKETSSLVLGHLAVGHDTRANPFMTLYFGGTDYS